MHTSSIGPLWICKGLISSHSPLAILIWLKYGMERVEYLEKGKYNGRPYELKFVINYLTIAIIICICLSG